MKYAGVDVLKYVIHVKEHHVHEERRDGASPARRARERRWRAGSAVVAGLLLLAVGSSGCATVMAQHKVTAHSSATHGSALQGSGNSEGGTGSLGKLGSALTAKGSKANAAGTLAGVSSGVMFGGDVPLAAEEAEPRPQAGDRPRLRPHRPAVPAAGGGPDHGAGQHGAGEPGHSAGPATRPSRPASEDATISAFLKAVNQAAIQYHLAAIYVTFEHEPDVP